MSKKLPILESSIVAVFFFSLLVSKAGIYFGLAALLILQSYLLIGNRNHLKEVAEKLSTIFKVSITLFILGILTTFPLLGGFEDTFDYFRKSAMLFLMPLLIVIITRNNNIKIALTATLSGLVIALCYAFINLYSLDLTQWCGERIDSFWDIGRWGEVLGYCIAILFPFTFEKKMLASRKCILALLLLLCTVCLFLSGGRAPLVALSISLGFYLVFRQPKWGLVSIIIIGVLIYLSQYSTGVTTIVSRISSITDISENYSNIGRLVMWKHGLEFSLYNLINDPLSFLFGTGINNMEIMYSNYLNEVTNISDINSKTFNQFSTSDMHNTYLDLLVRMGLFYLLLFIALLLVLLLYFYKKRHQSAEYAYSGMCLISTFSIIGIFYTSALEFQFTIFLGFTSLLYAHIIKESMHNEKV